MQDSELKLVNLLLSCLYRDVTELRERVKRCEDHAGLEPAAAPTVHINTHGDTSWAKAPVETVKELLGKHYSGEISIFNYWGIGDEREIRLGGGINETVQMVLTDKNVYGLTRGGRSAGVPCAFTVDQKNLLEKTFRPMNDRDTNDGGWECSRMREWLNSVYRGAFPGGYGDIFVPFVVDGGVDCFALRSEMELFGRTEYSDDEDGRQIEYYKTPRNRVKYLGSDYGSASSWWGRSPHASKSSNFCDVFIEGSAAWSHASNVLGVAPFGCL